MHKRERKTIPKFKTEEEEREFWSGHDSADYVDWEKGQRVKPANLEPTTRTVSIRLPETILAGVHHE
jgi:hypothetical protein